MNWSLCVHICLAERPPVRILALTVAVATARSLKDTAAPLGFLYLLDRTLSNVIFIEVFSVSEFQLDVVAGEQLVIN